jgi:hypothetical protein
MATSPTKQSLRELRKQGCLVAITERWCSFTKRRHDLFNFIDLLAIAPGYMLGVQTTSAANLSARVKKILTDEQVAPQAKAWLAAGGLVECHGWRLAGKSGKRKLWKLTVRRITLSDFPVQRPAAGQE